MSREIKKRKRQTKLLIIGSMCLLSVMTVGYAAFSTTLNISAKGNIINNKTTSETIKDKYCNESSGDGLYKDTTEEGRCVYRGANPDNYITFNGEEAGWRIIAIETDGTIKIMKMDNLGNIAFDTTNGRYQGSSGYCNHNRYGCNVWGSASTMLDASGNNVDTMKRPFNGTDTYTLPTEESQMTKYLNNDYYGTLTNEAKGQIDMHLWNVGPLNYGSGQSLETDVSQEKAYKWRGKIGLINPTDYIKSSTNAICISAYYSSPSPYRCKNNNYMYQSSYNWWTMSPFSASGSSNVWYVHSEGGMGNNDAYYSNGVRPVVYLTSDISLSGTGTKEDPYVIK